MGGQEVHNPTVLLMAGLASLALSAWPLSIQRGHLRLVEGLNAWSFSLIAQGLAWSGWAMVLLQYPLPVQAINISGNLLLMLSMLLQLRAFSRLLGLKLFWRFRVTCILITLALVIYSNINEPNLALRYLVLSVFKTVAFIDIVGLLAQSREAKKKLSARFLAYAYSFGAAYMLARTVAVFPHLGTPGFSAKELGFFQESVYWFYFFFGIFLTAGFISLCTQLYIHRFHDSEERIEASSKLLNFALESTVDAVWDYDFKTERVVFAKHWEQMLGYLPGEIHGDLESWESRIHPDDLTAMNEAITRYVNGKADAYEMTQRIRGKNGQYLWIKDRGIIVSRDANGKPVRLVGTMKNIDAEIRQREALRSAQIKYLTIFETMPVGVIIFNEQLQVLERNPAFLNQAGLAEADIRSGRYDERQYVDIEGRLIPEDQLPAAVAVREKRSVRDTVLGRNTPGGYRWFHSSVEPMHGLDLYAAIIMDVTDVIDAQRSLRRFNNLLEDKVRQRTIELEGANSELEAFSYSISHDLKAPLTRIEGWANALSEDFRNRLGEKAVGHIVHIRSEISRMEVMIAAAINLAKASSMPLAPEVCDMSTIAENISAELRKEFPQNTITADIAPGMRVTADPVLIEVALRNLLQNAVKFSAKKSLVKIEFGMRITEGGKAEYFIRDEGAGFNMRYADKLFAPFQRMHREADFKGTGIGLATVKRIIHRHGGQVRAESEPDKGTTICFTLPQRLEALE